MFLYWVIRKNETITTKKKSDADTILPKHTMKILLIIQ